MTRPIELEHHAILKLSETADFARDLASRIEGGNALDLASLAGLLRDVATMSEQMAGYLQEVYRCGWVDAIDKACVTLDGLPTTTARALVRNLTPPGGTGS